MLAQAVPKAAQPMVASSIRTIFAQPDQPSARNQMAQVARGLDKRFLRVADMLWETEDEIVAYMASPTEHWRQIHSTQHQACSR